MCRHGRKACHIRVGRRGAAPAVGTFTQFLTTYKYWQGKTVALERGLNIIEAPAFTYDSSFTRAGGPVYLVNPYTSADQNDSVKVYIDGGQTFPVFFSGGSERKFREDILDFTEFCQGNAEAFDIVEVMSDHILVTAQASQAKRIYIDDGVSVQGACDNWDAYMSQLLRFSGLDLDGDGERYDPRILKTYLNVRIMQPFSSSADAYATGQHIGIRKNTAWETTALRGSGFGWGMTHEIGHILENMEYRMLESTNNMWSNFNQVYMEGKNSNGKHDAVTEVLTPDSVLSTDGMLKDGKYDDTYVAWWNIESVFNGYWGRYNNLFRYGVPQGYPSAEGMSAVEKQVYYSSIAVGVDLGYYFDRYGYTFGGNTFRLESVSAAYSSAISSLAAQGKLSDRQYKLWYVGGETAGRSYKYGDKLAIYGGDDAISPINIRKEGNGYRIALPDRTTDPAHLGYEIIENGKVIGFTRTSTYFDGTDYGDRLPAYTVRAYDQKLGCTAESEVWQFTDREVARTGGRTYSTLSAALAAAEDGGTIVLLSDIAEEGLTVDKSVTLVTEGRPVTIVKVGDGNIFNISSGATLTLRGSKSAPVTVDGGNVKRGGRAFSSGGSLSLEWVTVKSLNGSDGDGSAINLWGAGNVLNISDCTFSDVSGTGRGGAVYVVANAQITVNIVNTLFSNCRTTGATGGAAHIGAPCTIQNTSFTGNRSENSGGALYLGGAGSSVLGCTFADNYANALDYGGGGAVNISAKADFKDCLFKDNAAYDGANGGSGGAARIGGPVTFTDCDFSGNRAYNGGVVYITSGLVQFNGCDIVDNRVTNAGIVYVSWSYGSIGANFDGCTITGNTADKGILYNGYYNGGWWGYGQTSLKITDTVMRDNVSANADIMTTCDWLKIDATGSTIVATVNKRVELSGGSDGLDFVINHDVGAGEAIVKGLADGQSGKFSLSSALAYKYTLQLSEDGQSLVLADIKLSVSTDIGGGQDLGEFSYGDKVTLPAAPAAPDGFEFVGWSYGGKVYGAGEEVELVSGGNISAVFVQHVFEVVIEYADGSSVAVGRYQKGDVIDLSAFSDDASVASARWQYKDCVYTPLDKVVFDGRNTVFTALYERPATPPDDGGTTPPYDEQQGEIDGELIVLVVAGVAVVALVVAIVFAAVHNGKRRR